MEQENRMGAMLSRQLGSGDKKGASRTAGNGIFLAIVIYLVFLVFAFAGIRPYLLTQSKDEVVLGMAQDYLFICTALGMFSLLFSIFEKMLQSTGKTIYSTVAQVCGALTNIVMDPIRIYGLLGFPRLGVKGAAYATVLGQAVSFIPGTDVRKQLSDSLFPATPCDPASARLRIYISQ